MKNTKMFLIIVALIVFSATKINATIIILDDGEIHNIDWLSDDVYSVYNSVDGAFTTVNILSGGRVDALGSFDDSRINFSGGTSVRNVEPSNRSRVNISAGDLLANLYIRDNSQLTVSGGTIHKEFWSRESTFATILGGEIKGYLRAEDNSNVIISGGSFGGKLIAYQNSTITIYGSGFNYPYGRLTGSGTLTGILQSGEIINNEFSNLSGDSKIFLVPEPFTFVFVGLGGLTMLIRRRA